MIYFNIFSTLEVHGDNDDTIFVIKIFNINHQELR